MEKINFVISKIKTGHFYNDKEGVLMIIESKQYGELMIFVYLNKIKGISSLTKDTFENNLLEREINDSRIPIKPWLNYIGVIERNIIISTYSEVKLVNWVGVRSTKKILLKKMLSFQKKIKKKIFEMEVLRKFNSLKKKVLNVKYAKMIISNFPNSKFKTTLQDYINDLILFGSINKLKSISPVLKIKNTYKTGNNSSANSKLYDVYEGKQFLENQEVIININLLDHIFDTSENGYGKFVYWKSLISNIATRIIPNFKNIDVIDLIGFIKNFNTPVKSKNYFEEINSNKFLLSGIIAICIKDLEDSINEGLNTNAFLKVFIKNVIKLMIKNDLLLGLEKYENFLKSIINNPLKDKLNTYHNLKIACFETQFFKDLLSILDENVKVKCVVIYKINDKGIVEMCKNFDNSINMDEYKIMPYKMFQNARIINEIIQEKISKKSDISVDCTKISISLNFKLTPSQKTAVHNTLQKSYIQITGAGGTGKTYTIGVLCNELISRGHRILLCTNYCVSKKILEFKFTTISQKRIFIRTAQAAYYFYSFNPNEADMIDCLIIDESQNMTNEQLANLFKVLPRLKRIIMLGDEGYQIQPIGYGNPMKQIYQTYKDCRVELKENVRVNKESKLKDFAEYVRKLKSLNELKNPSSIKLTQEYVKKLDYKYFYPDVQFLNFKNEQDSINALCQKYYSFKKESKNWFIMTPENKYCNIINNKLNSINTNSLVKKKKKLKFISVINNSYYTNRGHNNISKELCCYAGSKIMSLHKYKLKVIGLPPKLKFARKEIKKYISAGLIEDLDDYLYEKGLNVLISYPINPKEIVKIIKVYFKNFKGKRYKLLDVISRTPREHFKTLVLESHVKLRSLRVAFCTTVHGCLGSENYGSLIYLNPNAATWFSYNEIYTLTSRSKSKLIVYGNNYVRTMKVLKYIRNNPLLKDYKFHSKGKRMLCVEDIFTFCLTNFKDSNAENLMNYNFSSKCKMEDSISIINENGKRSRMQTNESESIDLKILSQDSNQNASKKVKKN